jgi:hypothetical protein
VVVLCLTFWVCVSFWDWWVGGGGKYCSVLSVGVLEVIGEVIGDVLAS